MLATVECHGVEWNTPAGRMRSRMYRHPDGHRLRLDGGRLERLAAGSAHWESLGEATTEAADRHAERHGYARVVAKRGRPPGVAEANPRTRRWTAAPPPPAPAAGGLVIETTPVVPCAADVFSPRQLEARIEFYADRAALGVGLFDGRRHGGPAGPHPGVSPAVTCKGCGATAARPLTAAGRPAANRVPAGWASARRQTGRRWVKSHTCPACLGKVVPA